MIYACKLFYDMHILWNHHNLDYKLEIKNIRGDAHSFQRANHAGIMLIYSRGK